MRIEAPTQDQARDVALRMRDSDFREFEATSFATTREELADALMARYAHLGQFIMATHEDRPVAIGALIEARPNVASLLFYATDEFQIIAMGLTRFITQRLFPQVKANGAHRIECVSIAGHYEAHRWIKVLGLEHQCEMRGYGKRGETFHQFAWIGDVPETGTGA
jgi:hypothetical protein